MQFPTHAITTTNPIAGELQHERRALMRFARHLCRSSADADDLVQDALIRMWRHQPAFPSEGHQRAWLKRVVLNRLIDNRRREQRARDWAARGAHDVAPSSIETETLPTALQRNLDALPVDYRNVLFLVDVCEASYQEAAEQLACPIGTVMSRLHRARRQLRDRLDREHLGGEPARESAQSAAHAA